MPSANRILNAVQIGTFDNHYAKLPERFFARVAPKTVAAPRLIAVNHALAQHLGLSLAHLAPQDQALLFSGNAIPDGAEPIATAYAGHQFGNFVPQLGDGRAILLGEVIARDGARYDIQFKGSGPTLYSRNGDGRAALGPVLREYLVSEAMHALGVPTTRALAATLTGERVLREQGPLPGAVLTRVASSHIRVGTFQFFAAREDQEALRALLDFAIARHDPTAREAENPALAFLQGVIKRQASLIAQWMSLGFIHGVMNTDNMTVSGETIDYGPCAFMEAYDPGKAYSFIDQFGRYAYARQPAIAQWNLARLAEALLPLIDEDEERAVATASAAITGFGPLYTDAYRRAMRAKLGLDGSQAEDDELLETILTRMHQAQLDFTGCFRSFAEAALAGDGTHAVHPLGTDEIGQAIMTRWHARLDRDARSRADLAAHMKSINPVRIPRNHRIEEVIEAAIRSNDFEPFHRLHAALQNPYQDDPAFTAYEAPATQDEQVAATFCGT